MRTVAIIKSVFNPRRVRNVISKVAKSETRINQAKFRQEQQAVREALTSGPQPVHYFEDLNILGLPKWY